MNPNMKQQLQAAPIQNPPRPTPILAQPIPNPNNRPTQPVQNLEVETFPMYVVIPAPFSGIELRSQRVVNKTNPTVVIQEEEVDNHTNQEEGQIYIQIVQRQEQINNPLNEERNTLLQQENPFPDSLTKEIPNRINPPYPERLLIKKSEEPLGYNLENELRNICVKITLLQAIKDIPISAKIVRDICIKKLGRKRKEPPVIQVVGKLSEFIT
jgi:hypothetical protein